MNKFATHAAMFASALLLMGACGKKDDSPHKNSAAPEAPPATDTAEAVDVKALAAGIGVSPGAFEPDDETGIEAVASVTAGTLSVRRVGEEQFSEPSADEAAALALYPGDQLRAGAGAAAEVKFADQTMLELAEESVIAVGDRDAAADPSSSAAVLYGVARFSVSQRGAGEGPFLVFTPGGVIGTKGTTYAVGVAVNGATRVGVEEGVVEVAGNADLAAPTVVTANQSIGLAVDGTLAATAEFTTDDWGTWRDEAEAEGTPSELVLAHSVQIETLEPQISAAYESLQELTAEVEQEDATAREMEAAGNVAGYEADAEARTVALDASFQASLRLEGLTYAMLSHAYLAEELHARHPDAAGEVYVAARPQVAGAVLYHKKYHSIVRVHVKPLRPLYYRHHPRGHKNAKLAAVPVPAFYLRAKIAAPPIEKVRARAKVAIYVPPIGFKVNVKKKVWVGAPARGWDAKVTVRPRDHRGEGWYAPPANPRAKLVVGVKVKRPAKPVFGGIKVVAPRSQVKVDWGAKGGVTVRAKRPGGVGVKVGGAVKVRGNDKVRVGVPARPGVEVRGNERVKAGRNVGVKVPSERGGPKVLKTPPGVGVKVKGGAGVKVKTGTGAGTKVIVKPPSGKVGGKVGVKVKGGVQIGGKKKP